MNTENLTGGGCGLRGTIKERTCGATRVIVVVLAGLAAIALAACGGGQAMEDADAVLPLGSVSGLTETDLLDRQRRATLTADEAADLAAMYRQRQAYAQALAMYAVALEVDAGHARSHYRMAEVLRTLGRYSDAIDHLQRTTTIVPQLSEPWFRLAVMFAQRAPTAGEGPGSLDYRDLAQAVEACRRAIQLAPDRAVYHQALGRAFELANEPDSALAAYEQAISLAPEAATLVAVGQLRLQAGDGVGALKALEQAVSVDSPVAAATQAETYHLIARAQEGLGNPTAAITACETALRLNPDLRKARFQLSRLYRQTGRDADAARELVRFQQLEAAGDSPLYRARMSVQRRPDNVDARRALAAALAAGGQIDEALDELAVARGIDSTVAAIDFDAALLHDHQGNLAAALAVLRRAVKLAPDSARYHLRLAQALAKQGDADGAATAFEVATELAPEWRKPLQELGMLHLKRRRPRDAEALFRRVLAMDPADADAHFGLSLACLDLDRPREAMEHLERTLATTPDYPRAADLLGHLRTRQTRTAGRGN